ncbi:MAG: YkgJ family cysteine cluster protein [Alphaproteobacteria bacterium]|nr:YkgJ family cysteine cluster protein [Alphaproteobacteria bacterium]
MSEQRFACTACGKCCYGWLPLSLDEALAHADKFPLAIALTPVKPSERHYKVTTHLGTVFQLPSRQKIALSMMPIAYIPASCACPALTDDNLCAIHRAKPMRCRTMPFYPYRDEAHQMDLLVPRKGWGCDTGPTAPVVYRDKRIVDPSAFKAERASLLDDAPALRAYVDRLLKFVPSIQGRVMKAAQSRIAGRVIVSLSSFLRTDQRMSLEAFAIKQHPVLEAWIAKTESDAGAAEYTTYYREAASDLEGFIAKG